MIEVTLTAAQEIMAAHIGFERQRNARAKGWPPRHRGGSLWGGNIESACAEYAASLATGLPWTGGELWEKPPVEKLPDLGTRTEVRWVAPPKSTRYEPHLRIDAERDKPDRVFLLVVGYAPRFEVIGFIAGEDARRRTWEHQYPERLVYEVPASELAPAERMKVLA